MDTYTCRSCDQELPASSFYSSNKSTCKSCIKAKRDTKKAACAVPGCENLVTFRSSTGLCKRHVNLARHNQVPYTDLESIAGLEDKKFYCKACGKEIWNKYQYCQGCSQIKRFHPEFSDEEIAAHESRIDMIEARRFVREGYKTYLEQMGLRKCPRCSEEKDSSEWYSEKRTWCKACEIEYNREYYHRKQKNDSSYKLRKAVSQAIRSGLAAVGSSKKGESVMDYLPYTFEDLRAHLESQFSDGMDWDNYGEFWHLDHIVPQALFSFTSMQDPQFLTCWALSNLQPLLAEENRKKSSLHNGIRWTYDANRWES